MCVPADNNNNNNTQICKAHIVGWWNPNLRRRVFFLACMLQLYIFAF